MNLNEEQRQAVEHFNGPCLVISVPGSGKTSMLVERTNRLIERGVQSRNILSITFTNKAADEMKERIAKRLGVEKPSMFVGTFHALCANILRVYGHKVGYTPKVTILDSDDQQQMVEKLIRQMGKSKKDDDIDVEKIINVMNNSREKMETEEEIINHFDDQFERDLVKRYFEELIGNNTVDFSGILYQAIHILEQNEDVLKVLQEGFKYIQVDEVQDTNFAQFRLINLLGGTTANILMVGDISQSIYAFRGARYKNIIDFLNMHPTCVKITLGKNYRSTPEIIKVADTLIKHNKSHMAEVFETDNPSGAPVCCDCYFEAGNEASAIVSRIKEYVNDLGWEYSDIAIFYRLNKLSLEVQNSLAGSGVPFTVVGGLNFFDRMEIKDSLAMLRFASNPKDMLAFHRVAGLFSGMGDANIGLIENLSKQHNIGILEVCQRIEEFSNRAKVQQSAKKIHSIFSKDFSKTNAGDALSYLVGAFDYYTHLHLNEKKAGEAQDRTDNVNELITNATEFSKKNATIEGFLQNMSLISANDTKNNKNAVTLMTLHACKGLEYPIVFMIGVENKLLPHEWPLNDAKTPEEKLEALEEERRICYVGFTRAKKHLHVSYCMNRKFRNNQGQLIFKKSAPSQFLKEAGFSIKEF